MKILFEKQQHKKPANTHMHRCRGSDHTERFIINWSKACMKYQIYCCFRFVDCPLAYPCHQLTAHQFWKHSSTWNKMDELIPQKLSFWRETQQNWNCVFHKLLEKHFLSYFGDATQRSLLFDCSGSITSFNDSKVSLETWLSRRVGGRMEIINT